MSRHIQLKWAVSHYVYNVLDGVRVRIWVESAVGVTAKVFAYQQFPKNPTTGEQAGVFDHVCSPPDLEEFPEDAPEPASRPAWFRLSYVDVIVRSVAEVDAFIEDVRADVRSLKATLDVMDELVPTGEEWIGGEPDNSSSSSSSESSLSASL
jgi:hypothetical protein